MISKNIIEKQKDIKQTKLINQEKNFSTYNHYFKVFKKSNPLRPYLTEPSANFDVDKKQIESKIRAKNKKIYKDDNPILNSIYSNYEIFNPYVTTMLASGIKLSNYNPDKYVLNDVNRQKLSTNVSPKSTKHVIKGYGEKSNGLNEHGEKVPRTFFGLDSQTPLQYDGVNQTSRNFPFLGIKTLCKTTLTSMENKDINDRIYDTLYNQTNGTDNNNNVIMNTNYNLKNKKVFSSLMRKTLSNFNKTDTAFFTKEESDCYKTKECSNNNNNNMQKTIAPDASNKYKIKDKFPPEYYQQVCNKFNMNKKELETFKNFANKTMSGSSNNQKNEVFTFYNTNPDNYKCDISVEQLADSALLERFKPERTKKLNPELKEEFYQKFGIDKELTDDDKIEIRKYFDSQNTKLYENNSIFRQIFRDEDYPIVSNAGKKEFNDAYDSLECVKMNFQLMNTIDKIRKNLVYNQYNDFFERIYGTRILMKQMPNVKVTEKKKKRNIDDYKNAFHKLKPKLKSQSNKNIIIPETLRKTSEDEEEIGDKQEMLDKKLNKLINLEMKKKEKEKEKLKHRQKGKENSKGKSRKRSSLSVKNKDDDRLTREELDANLQIDIQYIPFPNHPPSRTMMAMSYDPANGILYIYGGQGGKKYGDLWQCKIDADKLEWELMFENSERKYLTNTSEPSPRFGHTMHFYFNKLYIVGGQFEDWETNAYDEGIIAYFDIVTCKWNLLNEQGNSKNKKGTRKRTFRTIDQELSEKLTGISGNEKQKIEKTNEIEEEKVKFLKTKNSNFFPTIINDKNKNKEKSIFKNISDLNSDVRHPKDNICNLKKIEQNLFKRAILKNTNNISNTKYITRNQSRNKSTRNPSGLGVFTNATQKDMINTNNKNPVMLKKNGNMKKVCFQRDKAQLSKEDLEKNMQKKIAKTFLSNIDTEFDINSNNILTSDKNLDNFEKKSKKILKNTKEITEKQETMYYNKKPCLRRNHVSVLIGNSLFLYGGMDKDKKYLNDCWSYDLIENYWTKVDFVGLAPPPLGHHSACLALETEQLYHENLSLYNLPMSTRKTLPLLKQDGVFFFGGMNENRIPTNLLFVMKIGKKPIKFEVPKISGMPPSPRISCSMNFSPFLNMIIIHGGRNDINNDNFLNDFIILDLENLLWVKPTFKDELAIGRAEHRSAILGDKLIIFGGCNENRFLNFDLMLVNLNFFEVAKENIRKKEEEEIEKNLKEIM